MEQPQRRRVVVVSRITPHKKIKEEDVDVSAVAAAEEKGSQHSFNAVSESSSDSESSFELHEELSGRGGEASTRRGCNREKPAGKKRRADLLWVDSPLEAREDQEEWQDVGKKKQTARHPNVRCEPNKICDVVRLLTAPQREEVKKLGFECLLDFNMDSLGSRDLIVWLMDHLDPKTMILDVGGNNKLHITEHTVWCILGLQRGDFDPPLSESKISLSSLRKKLGVSGRDIKVKYLIQKIQSGGTDIFTMQCFMMIVLAKLLACSSSLYITESAWCMVQNIDNFGNINWCKFTVDQLKYSASMWKKPGGRKNTVYGCIAFLVMYYLDNLDCKQKMSCVETPRAKFFGKGMTENLVKADKLLDEDGLPTFGNLNLRTQRHTCYDERAESSRHVPTSMSIPSASDILSGFPNQNSDLTSCKSFCSGNKNKSQQQHEQLGDVASCRSLRVADKNKAKKQLQDLDSLLGDNEQQVTMYKSSAFVHPKTGGGSVFATQGPTPALEATAEFHGEPPIVPDVPQGDHAVTRGSEVGAAEAVQIAITFVNKQVKDFMAGTSEPEILESGLSKLVSLLAQMRALVASDAKTSQLDQQVMELTQKLCKTQEELEATRGTLRGAQTATLKAQSTLDDTQEELEATRVTLRGSQAAMLEAQSAIAAINCLALRLSAIFLRLGDSTESSPTPTVASSSLEEAVKLLEDRVTRIEPVCRGHATSLARSSVAFVAAALLCRDRERGLENLRDAVAGDTRRFVRSQGPEFHSLVDQVVVDAMEQLHGSAPEMQGGGRATGTAATSK